MLSLSPAVKLLFATQPVHMRLNLQTQRGAEDAGWRP